MNKKTLTIAGAAVLALTGLGGVGVAAASDQDTEGPEDAAEFQAFESSQISLTQAIAAAEADTSATAAEAEFEIEDGTAVFEIGMYRADGSDNEVNVDYSTGQGMEPGSHEESGDDDAGQHP